MLSLPACISCFLFIYQLSVRFNFVVGSLLSPLDLGNTPSVNMKLGSKFLNSLRIKTQLLKRLQRVIVVDSATHSQKDGEEGNRGSLDDGAEAFVLFLRFAQLVVRSSVLITVLGLDDGECHSNVTLEKAEIFGSIGAVWE